MKYTHNADGSTTTHYTKEEWQKYKIKDIANNFDKQRVPITANLRISGSTPYYGANGIQDYVDDYLTTPKKVGQCKVKLE